ncbi:MAG: TetR family transcriptional regulator [Actinobacteria bacterium]|nr:TetR family transcriptional regulator [Actinomycetota bacterium]
MAGVVTRQSKGRERRRAIIEAAAEIIRDEGPSAVTHRAVAARAECSLSATTYYFSGLDELLAEAGKVNIKRWAERAEAVADEVERDGVPATLAEAVEAILRACLPRNISLENHYRQLLAAAAADPIAGSYHAGRKRLDHALGRVLRRIGCAMPPELVIAVVDGAAVTAISEKRDVLKTGRELVTLLIRDSWQPPAPA